MEAALENRSVIEGSATPVENEGNPPAETANAAVPAEQSAASANQSAPLPTVKDVMYFLLLSYNSHQWIN